VIRALLPSLVTAGAISAGVALIVAALLARTITRPLRRLVGGVRTFATDHRARVPVAGPYEVRELGSAFNEMAAEIERARASEQAFLADISHELRTPLTSIHGFAQAIVEGEARGEGIPRAAEVIQRESRRLVRMVEGLLQVAKLEAGVQLLARESVGASELLRGAVAALDVQAKEAGVAFDVRTDALPVFGDPDRLSQLFINVLDNAVKHSPRGATVVVNGERGAGEVVVRVRDQGTGLQPGTEQRLFSRFWRGDSAAAARSGAGLGLAIAQAIAQAHGGSIDARNAPGGGAEFAIHLPAASA
jgi:signal transduction histidine kinase